MLAADPDRDLRRILAIDLHRRARRITGAAAHAFLLVDFERGHAIDHSRPDRRHRTTRDDRRALANLGDEIVIDLRRLGVLHIDRDIALPAAVDLAAGCRDAHAVRHFLMRELVVHHVHQALHDARCVGARNVAMQPALRVRDHRHGIAGAPDREAIVFQRRDQRLDLVDGAQHELDVRARGEPDMAFGELVADVAQETDRIDVHLALRAGANSPHFLAALGHVMQHARTQAIMPGPVAIVLLQNRMHERKRIRHAGFDRSTRLNGDIHLRTPPESP